MLSSVTWRKVRSMLAKELEERPKLGMMKEEVEDVCHWLLQSPVWDHLRRSLVEEVNERDGFKGQSLTKQAAFCFGYSIHKSYSS